MTKPTQGSSFQKKVKSQVPSITGSKLSVQTAQLLISSGVPSFDHVMGGGIPVGTIVLVEEDMYGSYARILLKYFLSEGVMCGHSLLVASQDRNPEKFVQELPAAADSDKLESGGDDKMTIAWRYQHMKTVQSSPSSTTFGHHFDLTKTVDKETLSHIDINFWNGASDDNQDRGDSFENSAFSDLLWKIRNCVEAGAFSVSETPEKRNILRIVIDSLGSPLWDTTSASQKSALQADLTLFLHTLRGMLRSAYAVCMVTVPSHLLQNPSLVKRCQHLSDTAVRLESFAGSDKETHPLFKDYHGLFHVTKLSAINTIMCHIPESIDLAFKLRRKKFLIEKLHLPPELQETMQREQDDIFANPSAESGCGGSSGSKKLLEF